MRLLGPGRGGLRRPRRFRRQARDALGGIQFGAGAAIVAVAPAEVMAADLAVHGDDRQAVALIGQVAAAWRCPAAPASRPRSRGPRHWRRRARRCARPAGPTARNRPACRRRRGDSGSRPGSARGRTRRRSAAAGRRWRPCVAAGSRAAVVATDAVAADEAVDDRLVEPAQVGRDGAAVRGDHAQVDGLPDQQAPAAQRQIVRAGLGMALQPPVAQVADGGGVVRARADAGRGRAAVRGSRPAVRRA